MLTRLSAGKYKVAKENIMEKLDEVNKKPLDFDFFKKVFVIFIFADFVLLFFVFSIIVVIRLALNI